MMRSKKPEWLAARAQLVILILLAVGVALDEGVYGVGLPWLIIPVAISATRFRWQVVTTGAVITVAAMCAATIPFDPQAVLDDPTPLLSAIVLLVAVTAITNALARGEIKHRSQAILDPLTGLLNRAALETRVRSSSSKPTSPAAPSRSCCVTSTASSASTTPTGTTAATPFCATSPTRSARRCAASSSSTASAARSSWSCCRASALDEAMEIAQRVRRAVAEAHPGDVDLTLSAGVACAAGEEMTYDEVFRAADAALFEAKREGRDRVVKADGLALMPVIDARRFDGDATAAPLP